MHAIDTIYNGFKFRSRLEARWAIYFDLIGLEYEYEPDGIDIDGIPYLPDFYIPKHNTFAEIKMIGALVYDYDSKLLQQGRENADKYNKAFAELTRAGYGYIVLCGSPIEIINDKDGAFWFVGDYIDNGVLQEVNLSHEYEAEAASYTRFEHGVSPYEMAKMHVESRRIGREILKRQYKAALADPNSLESILARRMKEAEHD